MFTIERAAISVTRWTLIGCLALVLATPGWASAQSRFSGIVVFGTSLSDPGNAFVLVGDASTPPDFMLNPFLIPSAPYARGGHHFSNGATWVEQFARSIGLGDAVRPALATTDPEVTNYAVGAARAYDDGHNFNDAFQILNAIVANPAAFDLTNVTNACVTPNVAPFTCKPADEFLFWDGIHPTKVGHAILAREAGNVLR